MPCRYEMEVRLGQGLVLEEVASAEEERHVLYRRYVHLCPQMTRPNMVPCTIGVNNLPVCVTGSGSWWRRSARAWAADSTSRRQPSCLPTAQRRSSCFKTSPARLTAPTGDCYTRITSTTNHAQQPLSWLHVTLPLTLLELAISVATPKCLALQD